MDEALMLAILFDTNGVDGISKEIRLVVISLFLAVVAVKILRKYNQDEGGGGRGAVAAVIGALIVAYFIYFPEFIITIAKPVAEAIFSAV